MKTHILVDISEFKRCCFLVGSCNLVFIVNLFLPWPCLSGYPFLHKVPRVFLRLLVRFFICFFVAPITHISFPIIRRTKTDCSIASLLFLSWPQKPTSLSRLASVIILLKLYLMIFLQPSWFSNPLNCVFLIFFFFFFFSFFFHFCSPFSLTLPPYFPLPLFG